MPASFQLHVVTPEREFYSGIVQMVVVRTEDGELGVLAGHAPMVAAVDIGPLRILHNGEWIFAVINTGFMEVTGDKVNILVDTAEWPHEIDTNRANDAMERAAERLLHKMSQIEYHRTQAALTRALVRLKASGRSGSQSK